MGTTADKYRRRHTREDDNWLRVTIAAVRKWIFERGLGVASAAVGRALNAKSLLPTRVCAQSLQLNIIILTLFSVHFQHG
jgi:hypothetical protein